jgi:hypothetical protein
VQTQKSKDKKWVGWFRPNGRGTKHGSLIAGTIDIVSEGPIPAGAIEFDEESGSPRLLANRGRSGIKLLVVSVPSSCGSAVQRNRFRRIVKARFAKCFTGERIVGEKLLERSAPSGETTDKTTHAMARKKGLWIRLLNRHRLGRKIRQEDWKLAFDEIEERYSQLKASL